MVSYDKIAKMIDHSLLKPELTTAQVEDGCRIAHEYGVASVCVRPSDVIAATEILKNSSVLVSTVIGFPHGTTTTVSKLTEAREAIDSGAVELDMVLNIGRLKSKDYSFVSDDIATISELAHSSGAIIKVIFENCYLTDDEKVEACLICNEIDVDYVKTSTGYRTGGAVDDDLRLMRKYCKPEIKLKAAGGIRTLERALQVRELGCSRIGATATITILEKLK